MLLLLFHPATIWFSLTVTCICYKPFGVGYSVGNKMAISLPIAGKTGMAIYR